MVVRDERQCEGEKEREGEEEEAMKRKERRRAQALGSRAKDAVVSKRCSGLSLSLTHAAAAAYAIFFHALFSFVLLFFLLLPLFFLSRSFPHETLSLSLPVS